jgi:threonine dehydrogenase-like Zn-dependent dehydrogenase
VKALVFRDVGEVSFEDVPAPVIVEPGDAIVRVTTGAICGSDLHVLHGKIPGMTSGSVLGHECVGLVDEIGPGVTEFRPGDRVVASFQIACGRCWFCRRNVYNDCDDLRVLGYGMLLGDLAGSQAERVRVPVADVNLLAVPESLTDDQAVFAGDILTTGFYAAKIGRILRGDTVAVIGAGPVGIFSVMAAQLYEPERVIAIDMVGSRLELAAKLGATTVNVTQRNATVAVGELTEGRGADVVIDAVGGSAAPFQSALDMARAGGVVVVIGVHADLEVPFPIGEVWRRNITIVMGGSCNVQAHWQEVLDLVAAGRLDPTVIISHTMPLHDGARAYELFDRREAQKIVLKP